MNDEIPGAVTTVTAITVDGRSVTSITSDGYHPSSCGVSMSDNESSVVLVDDVPESGDDGLHTVTKGNYRADDSCQATNST